MRSSGQGWVRRAGLAALVLTAVLVLQTGCEPGKLGRGADLDWLARQLPELHPDLFHQLPEAEYRKAIQDLRAVVDELNDEQYFIALTQIIASVGDGHMQLALPSDVYEAYGRYPIRLYIFPDGVYVIRAHSEIAELVGCRLVSIDGIPVEEVVARVTTLIPRLNDSLILQRAPALIYRPEVLFGLGVTGSKEEAGFVFVRPDDKEVKVQLKATKEEAITWSEGAWRWPTWFQYSHVIWHCYMEEQRTLYIQYNSCQEDLTEETAEIIQILDSKQVERIVLDLRRNSGGRPEGAQDLINALAARPKVQERGRLFIIVGRTTFSGAVINCYDFQRHTNAIFFGEPTGGKPNDFCWPRPVQLPYSGYTVKYSTSQMSCASGDPPSFVPEYLVQQSAEDFAVGRDTVLEAILKFGEPK